MHIGNITGPTFADFIGQIPLHKLAATEEAVKLDQAFDSGEEIKPVRLDEDGQPFLEFAGSGAEPLRQYVHSPILQGDIEVETQDGVSVARQVAFHQWRLNLVASKSP